MPIISGSTSSSGASIPAPATALPGSPSNGQLAVLTDSTTAPTYSWLLQYDTSITGTSKWRFIGGDPAMVVVQTDETTTSTTYVDLTTDGPSFTAPAAGTYKLSFSASVFNGTGAADQFVAIKFGAAATSDNDGEGPFLSALNHAEDCVRDYGAVALTASEVIKLQYRTSAGTGHFRKRALMVTPVLLG